jgi:hypothetical protein
MGMAPAEITHAHHLLLAAARGDGIRFLRFNVGHLAREAGCSEALARRYLQGQPVGASARERFDLLIGIAKSES